jgi:hypothetical protein
VDGIIKEWKIRRIRKKKIRGNYGSERIKHNFITINRESTQKNNIQAIRVTERQREEERNTEKIACIISVASYRELILTTEIQSEGDRKYRRTVLWVL